ncbi:MAG TPA: hypothetical protein VFH73_26050 [Polyangia bacterium]|nr:hypothetical protein [Polyangia bacterium]
MVGATFSKTIKPDGPPRYHSLPPSGTEGQRIAIDTSGPFGIGGSVTNYTWTNGQWHDDQGNPAGRAQPGSPGVPLPGSWQPGSTVGAVAPTAPAPGAAPGSWTGTPTPVVPPPPLVQQPQTAAEAAWAGRFGTPAKPGSYTGPTFGASPPSAGPAGMRVGFDAPTPPHPADPSYAGFNGQAADITAGLRNAYDASKEARPVPTVAAPPPVYAPPVKRADLPQVGGITASQAGGNTLTHVGGVDASQATKGTLTRAGAIGPTTISRTEDEQIRQRQQDLLAGLQAAADGKVASAAELQSRQALDRNVSNQYALAASLQGRSPGGALKTAADAVGDLNAHAAADAAILRATETAGARNTYANMLSGVRGQDIGVATDQAGLEQAGKVQNQNVEVTQSGQQFAANNDLEKFNTGLRQDTAVGNANRDVTQNTTQFAADNDREKFNAGLRQGADITNQGAAITQNATRFGAENDLNKFDVSNTIDLSKFNVTETDKVALNNQDAALKARQLDDASRSVILQGMLIASGHQLQGVDAAAQNGIRQQAQDFALKQLAQAKSAADRAYWTGIVGSILGAGASGLQSYLTGGGSGGTSTGGSGGQSTVNGETITPQFGSQPGETNNPATGDPEESNNGIADGST